MKKIAVTVTKVAAIFFNEQILGEDMQLTMSNLHLTLHPLDFSCISYMINKSKIMSIDHTRGEANEYHKSAGPYKKIWGSYSS